MCRGEGCEPPLPSLASGQPQRIARGSHLACRCGGFLGAGALPDALVVASGAHGRTCGLCDEIKLLDAGARGTRYKSAIGFLRWLDSHRPFPFCWVGGCVLPRTSKIAPPPSPERPAGFSFRWWSVHLPRDGFRRAARFERWRLIVQADGEAPVIALDDQIGNARNSSGLCSGLFAA